MSDERAALTGEKQPIPDGYRWADLIRKEGVQLEAHYRETLRKLGDAGGMLGLIFRKAQNKIQDPSKLRQLIVELIGKTNWLSETADVKGDAYEGLLERNAEDVKSGAGQYFTPRALIHAIVDCMQPAPGERIVDPACGTGGFLLVAHDYLTEHYELDREQKHHLRFDALHGIELVDGVSRLCAMNLFLHGIGPDDEKRDPPIHTDDSLRNEPKDHADVVLTNPPFGKKIVIEGDLILSQFDLGYKWKRNKETKSMEKTTALHDDQPPQILFLERCLQLLKPGGRLGIVLPEAVFGMPTYEYAVFWLQSRAKIRGVVSMPEALFKTSGKGGTHAKVCVLFVENTEPKKDEDYDIFMADVKWCGHDSRGNPTIRKDKSGKEVLLDEVPKVAERWAAIIGKW
jgi:type I restriction enzyme M protein